MATRLFCEQISKRKSILFILFFLLFTSSFFVECLFHFFISAVSDPLASEGHPVPLMERLAYIAGLSGSTWFISDWLHHHSEGFDSKNQLPEKKANELWDPQRDCVRLFIYFFACLGSVLDLVLVMVSVLVSVSFLLLSVSVFLLLRSACFVPSLSHT
jgi:hypothetical protein